MGKVFNEKWRYKEYRKANGLLPKKKKKKGERTFSDTWITRASKLKTSYKDYLKSDHWKALKKKAKRRKRYKKCLFCGNTKVELHHTTYKWIYTKKELLGIIPLCRKHHQAVHDYASKHQLSIRIATNHLKSCYV